MRLEAVGFHPSRLPQSKLIHYPRSTAPAAVAERECTGPDRPAHDSPHLPDSPGGLPGVVEGHLTQNVGNGPAFLLRPPAVRVTLKSP
jgi:hypothetical protein